MNNFDKAIPFILESEGGYTNDTRDPGGETKYGIAKSYYPQLDIKTITIDEAKGIYYRDYWLKIKADQMPWPLCLFYFDCAVNQGQGIAPLLLQKALGITADGIVGPLTIRAANNANQDHHSLFMSLRVRRYFGTKNYDIYGDGWLKRLFKCAIYAGKNSD